MSTSTGGGDDDGDSPDLVCQMDCVQGMVDALSSVRWKRHQDAVIELSAHGIVIIVEESGCLQAKVYLKRKLFILYDYGAQGRPRFVLSLRLQLLLKSMGSPHSCLCAEIRTRIPDTISRDYHFEHSGNTPLSFTVKVLILQSDRHQLITS